MKGGVENLLITHGGKGAYFFGDGVAEHIPVEKLGEAELVDTTGSGDQVIAVVAGGLLKGMGILEVVYLGVRAGTRQCMRLGAVPLGWGEI
jgi:sugar/nucleoside kinase (ribokinase family)